MKRAFLYAAANLAFLVCMAISATSGGSSHLFYLCMLFALCSTALLVERPLNGPYSILCLLLAIFFVFYGLQDAIAAGLGKSIGPDSDGALTPSEMAVLLGSVLAVIGYVVAVATLRPSAPAVPTTDWPPGTVVLVGVALWLIGSYAAWVWSVDLIVDTKNTTTTRALSSISALKTTLLMLGQMAKPLGMLMIAYAQTMYRRPYLLPLLVVMVITQLVYGYIIDVKGEAMIGMVLVILTKVFVSSRLPKAWLVIGAVFVALAFPVLQAHRVISGARGTDHAETARDLGKSLALALASSEKQSTARRRESQTFFERASLKGSVEKIVARTGNGVAYQDGATLAPLLTTFIPKIIWPGKPSIPVGQLMNSEFHISIYRDTYISPSHLGELYWNFGWTGILLGMPIIGFILGAVGARCNLHDRVSLTRLLIMVVTIRYIVMGFEGSIAVSYVVWLRSIAGIGALHLLLGRASLSGAALQREPRHSQGELEGLGQTRTVSVP